MRRHTFMKSNKSRNVRAM